MVNFDKELWVSFHFFRDGMVCGMASKTNNYIQLSTQMQSWLTIILLFQDSYIYYLNKVQYYANILFGGITYIRSVSWNYSQYNEYTVPDRKEWLYMVTVKYSEYNIWDSHTECNRLCKYTEHEFIW